MKTIAMSDVTRIACGIVLAAGLVLAPAFAIASPGADGYIEGYATAVLEREFRVAPASLRVQSGKAPLRVSRRPWWRGSRRGRGSA